MQITVAVPGPVRHLFTYEVPEPLQSGCGRGVRVIVPFGRRRLVGYVTGISDPAGDAQAEYVVRPIEAILDAVPALDTHLLELTRWAADYYGASWGDLIRTALPGFNASVRRRVGLTSAGGEALARGRAGERVAIRGALEALAAIEKAAGRTGSTPVTELRRRAGVGIPATMLTRLARAGWVNLDESLAAGGAPRMTEWVLPASIALGSASPGAARLGRRQAETLTLVAKQDAGLPLAELQRLSGATRASVRALQKRGLLRIEPRPAADRRPLALLEKASAPEAAPLTLTGDQSRAVEAIVQDVRAGRFAVNLVFGVTGSGKTEIYLRAIEAAIAAGRQAIYLVPEIGLTPLLAHRLQARFGEVLALLHSGLSDGERQDEWRRVRSGRVKLVLGARSAVFAPLPDLGLLIVDEEQDTSYKQDEHPRYNGRDLAIVRGRMGSAAVVLGSATPSIESYHNALGGKYGLLTLTGRVGGAVLPTVHRVDMRREFEEVGKESVLSRRLLEGLRARLDRGEQSLVLLNRRGFSTFVLCRVCGEAVECRQCSIAMTLHLRERRLRCHYCNDSRSVPAACPKCGSGHLHFGGTGTERLEETLRSYLPAARIARMDRDTVRGRGSLENLLWRVERGEVDILLGTQMIAKGHDFPNVTLVGVLAADALLGRPDFRAGEHTFQLLAQVAGRSGRRERPGEVIVQAYDPDHHAVRTACEQDYEAFARAELAYRKALDYPPFTALALLVFRDRNPDTARERASRVAAALRQKRFAGLNVLGPAPAPLERLRGEYRMQVLLKAARRPVIREALADATAQIERLRLRPESVTVDVDPVSTL